MAVVKEMCRKRNIKIDKLYYGRRRRNVSFASAQAAWDLWVITSAIFNMLKRKNDKFNYSRTSPYFTSKMLYGQSPLNLLSVMEAGCSKTCVL
jgi:hypothetical protein